MRKVLLLALTAVLAVGAIVGLALPGMAAGGDEAEDKVGCRLTDRILRGVVEDVVAEDDQQYFTMEEGEVTVWVNEDTRYVKVNLPVGIATQVEDRGWLREAESWLKTWRLEIRQRLRRDNDIQELPSGRIKALQPMPIMNGRRVTTPNLPSTDIVIEQSGGVPGNLFRWRWFDNEATFEDIYPGDKVVVHVVPGDEELVAKLVIIMEPPTGGRVIGEIISVDTEVQLITIKPNEDTENGEMAIYYDDDTVFRLHLRGTPYLAPGMNVLVIYVEETGGDMLARSVVSRISE